MESVIRLCYCPLPRTPLRLSYFSKASENARESMFHLRFNHANLCLSHSYTSKPIACSSKHTNCMLDSFSVSSKHEGNDNKILRGMSGASLVLACVLGLLNFNGSMNPKFNTAYASPNMFSHAGREVTLPQAGEEVKFPQAGDEVTLESLLKMINEEPSNQACPKFKHEPDDKQVEELKLYAIGQSKSGRKHEEKALKIVKDEYERYKDSQAGYSLRTALLQLLIFQGKIEQARKLLDSKIDEEFKDPKKLKYEEKIDKLIKLYKSCVDEDNIFGQRSIAQLLLYKAIIHTMLKDKEAAKWGKAFEKVTKKNDKLCSSTV